MLGIIKYPQEIWYQGESEERAPGIAATLNHFFILLGHKDNYHYQNHVVVTDNWYTSIQSMI
jgi:hypothetical protein